MKHHWSYLKYVLKHKWFVFVAGRKLGTPLWQLVVHDLSKFSRIEWTPYVNSFYAYHNGGRPQWVEDAFDIAWLHHQNVNKHHWQYWVLVRDTGSYVALQIPKRYVSEMVADWAGAGRVITGKWELKEWYTKNNERIIMHPETRTAVETLIEGYDVG